ncbi:TPA: hypothetical protein ACUB1K_001938 [Klebsiella michiganensis]|uniref:hypothetical protein n=1 Tax=Klebsiella michiganensis TaxID=1134687 RepID=UPI000668ED41|nr:hypothetical protein [Klebsiella michiganensis]MDG9982939.1 hypothetical protein [Klebsiella michiganensis]MDH0829989.1 hypothetical protein [Klebsiella michiganensis]MDH0842453.1 hypothetical protein [Klebsiella michiganensis]HED2508485.1 hypothetical protein [Klebsiella michiganensis]
MKEILEQFFKFIQYCMDNSVIEAGTALFIVMCMIVFCLSLLKIEFISNMIDTIKNRRKNELLKILSNNYTSAEQRRSAEIELSRLQNKELCGFDDVLRQCYCVDLASKYHNLVTISFFKKFQSSIVICNSFTPSIKTGVYLRIEWFLGVIYSIHLILIAGLFIFLSALGNKELSFWKHGILYLMAMGILWLCVIISKQFPSRLDIRLLEEIKRQEAQ